MLELITNGISRAYLSELDKEIEDAFQKFQLMPDIDAIPNFEFAEGGIYRDSVSSFTIKALFGMEKVIKCLGNFLNNPSIQHFLPSTYFVNIDQVWIRRQYPQGQEKHMPHHWHQDGALNFPYLSEDADFKNGLLDMTIIWVPMRGAGENSPSLEFITKKQDRVLELAALSAESVNRQYEEGDFYRPALQLGDLLIFSGDLLHRTYVKNSFTEPRTSIGIRIFNRIPDRLSGQHFESKLKFNF